MTVYVVIDHVCEADILVGVFSSEELAESWIKDHKDDMYSPNVNSKRYESLEVYAQVVDQPE